VKSAVQCCTPHKGCTEHHSPSHPPGPTFDDKELGAALAVEGIHNWAGAHPTRVALSAMSGPPALPARPHSTRTARVHGPLTAGQSRRGLQRADSVLALLPDTIASPGLTFDNKELGIALAVEGINKGTGAHAVGHEGPVGPRQSEHSAAQCHPLPLHCQDEVGLRGPGHVQQAAAAGGQQEEERQLHRGESREYRQMLGQGGLVRFPRDFGLWLLRQAPWRTRPLSQPTPFRTELTH